jgi:hypothetical protein
LEDLDYQMYKDKKIEEITAKALELKELNQRAIEAILSNDVSRFFDIYDRFYKIRDGLNNDFHHFGVLNINDENARLIINKISTGDTLEIENIFSKLREMVAEVSETEDGEDQLFDYDFFDKAHQWFSIYYDFLDIFTRRYSFGPIALKLTKHKFIDSYINEAFECYSFGSYNALSSMCRTIIEAAMRDIWLCTRKKEKIPDIIAVMINELTQKGSTLNKKVWKIYGKASKVVHGKITRDEEYAKELLKETIIIVKNVYEVHGLL